MKIEIEIPDLEEIYYSYHEGESLTGKDFKEKIVYIAIEKFIDRLYDNYMNDMVYESIKNDVREVVKNHSNDIVDKVINRVADEIIKKEINSKRNAKKSEIANISKEW